LPAASRETQRLTAGWYSTPHHTDDDGERPPPVGQVGQIPAADVPLDLSAQLRRQCRYTLANWTVMAAFCGAALPVTRMLREPMTKSA
jgi:hypothetical protein